MTKYNTSHLLESVVKLTSLRDQHSLEVCLIKTLQELIPTGQIMLFAITGESDKHTLKLLVEIDSKRSREPETENHIPHCVEDDPDLLQCFTTGQQLIANEAVGVRVIHPLMGANGVVGFLAVRNDSYIEKDQAVAASFLNIYQNYLQLINDNEHDTLTGLLNRKTFDERILAVMSARSSGRRVADIKESSCCLAILDIDHFKKVNDQFGHLYGDEVLLLFAQIMTRTFRDDDQLFRYGGEEFVVVLKDVDLTVGLTVLERFRKAVESYHFPQVGAITASVGAVTIDEQDLPTTIISQADQALYYAKENGRNQVCAYDQLLREGKLASVAPTEGDIELF
jgi:diguanylate cyclase (GGDEF)-like protein